MNEQTIQTIEKIFKNYSNPETDIARFSQRFSTEINEGERELDKATLQSINLSKIYKITFNNQSNIGEVSKKLAASGQFENVELNYILTADFIPSDPYFLDTYPSQVNNRDPDWLPTHDYQWNLKMINMPQAWDITKGSKKVITAVLDGGIDYNHRDLKDHMWQNRDEIPNNAIDDDANGFIDDALGWNFIDNTNSVLDDGELGHGTFVAGQIVGNTNDSNKAAFMNWNAKLMPVKVLDLVGRGKVSQVMAGVYYATNNGADVINMSLGGWIPPGDVTSSFQKSISYAFAHGVVVVASAGNNGLPLEASWQDSYSYNYSNYIEVPAYFPNVLKVGSVSPNGDISRFSNFAGQGYFVTAPGGGNSCF
ncbi:S8 family serine peptidase [Candidatus Roizmanbacteria bacterium]|nr:S8 family serine peptidase [Candidatus Roizmanbacteria bacterium]